jgi:hypothetical protein
MVALKVQRQDYWYTANLTTPAFALVDKWVDLSAAIVGRFASFGAGPDSLVYESPSGHPKDFVLACLLPAAVGSVRFRLKSVEVWTTGSAPARDPRMRVSLMSETFLVLEDMHVDVSLDTQTAAISCHGELAEGPFAARIAEYVPKAPNTMDVTGVTFHKDFGTAGQGFIDLQPSYTVLGPSSVFFGASLRGARGLPPGEVHGAAVRLFESSLKDLGLEADWSTLK